MGSLCQYPGPVHTPWVLNQLKVNGQTVGGWSSGGMVCSSCYVSFGTEDSITPTPGEQVEFDDEVFLECVFAGDVFDSGWVATSFRIATTYWGPPPIRDQNGDCHWANLACSSGTPSCTFVRGVQFFPGCPQYARSDTLVVGGSCNPDIAVESGAAGPGPCD
jgi:hypothetical protein